MDSEDDPDDSDYCESEINETIPAENEKVVNDLDFVASIAEKELEFTALLTTMSDGVVPQDIIEDVGNEGKHKEDSCDEIDEESDDDSVIDIEYVGNCSESDEESVIPTVANPVRTKNEIPIDYRSSIVVSNVSVNENDKITPCGAVIKLLPLERLLIVQSDNNLDPLNEGSFLCNYEKMVIGKIIETFGPLHAPFYVVQLEGNIIPEDTHVPDTDTASVSDTTDISKALHINADSNKEILCNNAVLQTLDQYGSDSDTENCVNMTVPAGDIDEYGGGKPDDVIAPPCSSASGAGAVPPPEDLTPAATSMTVFLGPLTRLFSISSHVHYVTPSLLLAAKSGTGGAFARGSDASNIFDEEVRRFLDTRAICRM